MKLITDDLTELLPPLYTHENTSDPICPVKFFCPWGLATWWVYEYDPESRMCFGYALLDDPDLAELGYFSLEELEAVRGPFGLTIERDLHYTPQPLSVIVAAVKKKTKS